MEVLDGCYPDYTTSKKLTFAGVLQKYMDEYEPGGKNIGISRYWNSETKNTYIRDYNLRLLPRLDMWKGLDEYVEQDFDELIDEIEEKYQYSESTKAHYRHLIYVVCKAGYTHGHCEDILWGTRYGIAEQEDETAKGERLVRLKKSFTPKEDIQVSQQLFRKPDTRHGEDVGLLLMYCCAFRNNEACGLNYGHLQEMREHSNCYTLLLYQTTKVRSRDVKKGGKTKNANRILPVMDCLRDYLLKRKAFIQQKIEENNMVDEDGNQLEVNKLPIVCRGQDFCVRCNSEDLTRQGRKLFKKIGIQNQDLVNIEQHLAESRRLSDDVQAKDATTYLFRRNAGTMLHMLGLSLSQIQYYMGQDVEEMTETRNGYTNEHKLFEMKQVLEAHPINHLEEVDIQPVEIGLEEPIYQSAGKPIHKYRLPMDGKRVQMCISAKEMLDKITLHMKSTTGQPIHVEIQEQPQPLQIGRNVNIQKQIWSAYQSAYETL